MKNIIAVVSLSLLACCPLAAQAIIGSWHFKQGTNSEFVFSFLKNGTYIMAEVGKSGSGGKNGMERGTYTWNSATGAFSSKTLVDTNGEWGLSDGTIKKITVTGNTLKIADIKMKKVASAKNKLVGGWYVKEGSGYAVVTFLPDGTYFMAQDGKRTKEERSGIERGTYSWNASTKLFTNKVLVDTNGGWGFSNDYKRTINIAGARLTLNVIGEGKFTLSSVK